MTTENTSIDFCAERHWKPSELAKLLGYSVDTIYREFRGLPGVLEIGSPGAMHRRKKQSIRVPDSVFRAWHERHRAKKKAT